MNADFGWWPLVIINTAVLLLFAVSFYHPGNNRRDWTVMGGFSLAACGPGASKPPAALSHTS